MLHRGQIRIKTCLTMTEQFSERVTLALPKSVVRRVKKLSKAQAKKPTEIYREAIMKHLSEKEEEA